MTNYVKPTKKDIHQLFTDVITEDTFSNMPKCDRCGNNVFWNIVNKETITCANCHKQYKMKIYGLEEDSNE